MHPCCWGNLLREIAQFLPFLAVLALAVKQFMAPLMSLFKKGPSSSSSCSSSSAASQCSVGSRPGEQQKKGVALKVEEAVKPCCRPGSDC